MKHRRAKPAAAHRAPYQETVKIGALIMQSVRFVERPDGRVLHLKFGAVEVGCSNCFTGFGVICLDEADGPHFLISDLVVHLSDHDGTFHEQEVECRVCRRHNVISESICRLAEIQAKFARGVDA